MLKVKYINVYFQAKIKELKAHIISLEKEIEDLKEQLRQRDTTIAEMKIAHEQMVRTVWVWYYINFKSFFT